MYYLFIVSVLFIYLSIYLLFIFNLFTYLIYLLLSIYFIRLSLKLINFILFGLIMLGTRTCYGLDDSTVESRWTRPSAPVHIGPVTHQVSSNIGRDHFPVVKRPDVVTDHLCISSA
jgi:hypothetical protein